jgi:hypothetical protein
MIATALALMMTANLIDLIPNATQTTLTWLWAGALAGRMELRNLSPVSAGDSLQSGPSPKRKRTAYARGQLSDSPYRRNLSQRHSSR